MKKNARKEEECFCINKDAIDAVVESNMFKGFSLVAKTHRSGGYFNDWLISLDDDLLIRLEKAAEKDIDDDTNEASDLFACSQAIAALKETGTLHGDVPIEALIKSQKVLCMVLEGEFLCRMGVATRTHKEGTWDPFEGSITAAPNIELTEGILEGTVTKKQAEFAKKALKKVKPGENHG